MFGAWHADAHRAGLERTFDLLASFPRIGWAEDMPTEEVFVMIQQDRSNRRRIPLTGRIS